MSKLALVATIKTVPGKREEYLKHLKAHAKRCLATEPGTLKFDILVPQEEADTVMLYEVYSSPEAFEAHWNGPSKQQAERGFKDLKVSASGVRCEIVEAAVQIDEPKIPKLREMVATAQEEFEYAIQFHEVWKIAADDSDLHRRMGRSYASQAFLIIRSAIRREMLLALMRLWDRNKQAIRITWVVATLREEKGLIDALAANRVRGDWPGDLETMRRDLQKLADEVLLLANKYMEGGSHNAAFKKLEKLRDEHLAHRQVAQTTVVPGTDLDRKETDEFFHDTGTIIKKLNSLVNAVGSDPEGSAGVYRHYAQFFWAAACGERTEGHPNFRPRSPSVER